MSGATAERRELWQRLAEAALVEGDEPSTQAPGSPWFVRVMLGVAGWIGALFLLGFGGLTFSFLMESAPAALVAGSLVCVAAAFLLRWRGDNDFLAQLAFALSLAGQGLLVVGVDHLLGLDDAVVALAMAVVEAALFVLVPSFLHRVWTAGAGAAAVTVALFDWHLAPLAPALLTMAFAWVWLRELEDSRRSDLWCAAGYGLTLVAMGAVVVPWEPWRAFSALGLVAAALSGAALVYVVLALLRRDEVPLTAGPARAALVGTGLLALATLLAPGLAPAVAILVLGRANGNRLLTGLGILALLGYLSSYYYSLETTLLVKSALLAGVGAALLLARLALHRWWPVAPGEGEVVEDA